MQIRLSYLINSVAWYQADAATKSTAVASVSGTMATSSSTVSAVTYFLQVKVNTIATAIDLTTYNGYCYAITGVYTEGVNQGKGTLVAATPKVGMYGTLSLSFEWYDTQAHAEAGENDGKLSDAVKNSISAQNLQLTFTPNGRTRLTSTDPSSGNGTDQAKFANAFGSAHSAGTALQVTANIAAGGTVTLDPIYYSISGTEEDVADQESLLGTLVTAESVAAIGGISSITGTNAN